MATATMGSPMADDKPKTLSVKLPMDVVESARIVSAFRGEPMTEMLGELLRPILARMEREEIAKRTKLRGKREGEK
jgi:hypothetical protein